MHFLHTPILTHLFSPSCLSHPIFTFLWLFLARSWHVGLSGPLIMWKFAEKMPDARPGHPFCASLRSRNAHGHVTRAILCGNLHTRNMPDAPDTMSMNQRPLTLTVRTPSVWPHCLGDNMSITFGSGLWKEMGFPNTHFWLHFLSIKRMRFEVHKRAHPMCCQIYGNHWQTYQVGPYPMCGFLQLITDGSPNKHPRKKEKQG